MKAIMVMYDSLNRNMLEPYGCDWTITPNFKRLAEKSVMFNNNYVSSLPCMPARRELHTGRYNFLHRSWGPMEPFDDSMPEILKKNGIYTHLVSDHQHYWEDGGCTYHTRYNSWEISRGQEGDTWKGKVNPQKLEETAFKTARNMPPGLKKIHAQDIVNRQYIDSEEKMPQAVTFKYGLEFIENNYNEDNWFLQIETFDPHEPFYSMQEYKDLYPHEYEGKRADWPPYTFVDEDENTVNHVRYEYAALLSMCDRYLGKVLDMMDKYNLWEDTMLIVNTDHGYLLGEHGWWSKSVMPVYNEIAHTPLFIYDPRNKVQGVSRNSLTQTIDIPATLLEFFNMEIPKDMQGKPLTQVIENDLSIREYALFGYHGGHINITDGEFVYMKAPNNLKNSPLYEYTLMPTHMRTMFNVNELQEIELNEPFTFTKGCKVMKIKAEDNIYRAVNFGTKLFNIKEDPNQEKELDDLKVELKMSKLLIKAMNENDSPKEQFTRLSLKSSGDITTYDIMEAKNKIVDEKIPNILKEYNWNEAASNMFRALNKLIVGSQREEISHKFEAIIRKIPNKKEIVESDVLRFIDEVIRSEDKERIMYIVKLNGRIN